MVEINTIKPQMKEFFYGISVFFYKKLLYIFPPKYVTAQGMHTSIDLSTSTYESPVIRLTYGITILDRIISTSIHERLQICNKRRVSQPPLCLAF